VKALLRKAYGLGQEFPSEGNRIFLEIVAKRKIAQHFEKSMMPRGMPDILQIVVLATNPETFLCSYSALVRALLRARENALELDHTGVCEEKGRISSGNQRRTRYTCMISLLKVLEE
jgi:hypothetical protein